MTGRNGRGAVQAAPGALAPADVVPVAAGAVPDVEAGALGHGGDATTRVVLTERQAQRLLERWCMLQGAEAAAAAAVAAAERLRAAYAEEVAHHAEVPAGADVRVDVAERTLTIARPSPG